MIKRDKKKSLIISLLIAVVAIWIIITALLYMRIYTPFIVVLVFITAILIAIDGKLLSNWENKKAGWILCIAGTIALVVMAIIGYHISIGRLQ